MRVCLFQEEIGDRFCLLGMLFVMCFQENQASPQLGFSFPHSQFPLLILLLLTLFSASVVMLYCNSFPLHRTVGAFA